MNVTTMKNNKSAGSAPLRNIHNLDTLVIRARDREEHLPGIVTFSGPTGFGKSTAAAYVAARHQACYVEFRSMWTKKAFLESLCVQLGVTPEKTAYKMLNQASEEMALGRRPVILDEFDHAVAKEGMVELVRDLYEQSRSPIILIGEERLPHKLQKWERFHGRIMDWAQAQPANLDDAAVLAQHYAGDLTVADDLLQRLVDLAQGNIRYIVTNLDRIVKLARAEGLDVVTLADWGDRQLHTASAPKLRYLPVQLR